MADVTFARNEDNGRAIVIHTTCWAGWLRDNPDTRWSPIGTDSNFTPSHSRDCCVCNREIRGES